MMDRRKLDLSIISDAHLGSYACHARELLRYLKSIKPEVLILNGDFVNLDKIRKNQLPEEHSWIIDEVVNMAYAGTKVYYISSNKTDNKNSLAGFSNRLIHFRESLELHLKGQKYWIFHGAAFAPSFRFPFFTMKPGSRGYNLLFQSSRKMHQWRYQLIRGGKYIEGDRKDQEKKKIVQGIEQFEEKVIQFAQQKDYDYIVCGYTHKPVIKTFKAQERVLTYMNAGDWVEHLTTLEYRFGKWKLYTYDELDYDLINPKLVVKHKRKKIKQKRRLKYKRFGSIVEPKSLNNNQIIEEKEFRNGTSDIR